MLRLYSEKSSEELRKEGFEIVGLPGVCFSDGVIFNTTWAEKQWRVGNPSMNKTTPTGYNVFLRTPSEGFAKCCNRMTGSDDVNLKVYIIQGLEKVSQDN